MYLSLDSTGKIIAIHDDKEVVEKYNMLIYHHHKIRLDIIKAKKKNIKNSAYFDDLYLVRYGETYVQAGYLTYIQLAYGQATEDEKYAKDILLRILELNKISNKERKTLSKAVEILDRQIYSENQYTPSLNELKRLKSEYDPYIYNYGIYE